MGWYIDHWILENMGTYSTPQKKNRRAVNVHSFFLRVCIFMTFLSSPAGVAKRSVSTSTVTTVPLSALPVSPFLRTTAANWSSRTQWFRRWNLDVPFLQRGPTYSWNLLKSIEMRYHRDITQMTHYLDRGSAFRELGIVHKKFCLLLAIEQHGQ